MGATPPKSAIIQALVIRAVQYYDIYHYRDISVWYRLEIQYRDIVIIVFLCIYIQYLQNLEVLALYGSNVSDHYIMVMLQHFILCLIVMLATVLLYSMLLQTEGLQGTKYQYRDN